MTVATAVPGTHAVPRELLIAAALVAAATGLAILLLARSTHTPLVAALLGTLVGSFVLVAASPAWALAPLLLVEFAFPNYMVTALGMSLRLVVLLAVTFVSVPAILQTGILTDSRVRRVVIPAFALVVVATMINTLFEDSDYVAKYFRYQCTQLCTVIVAASVLRSRDDVKRLAYIGLFLGLLCSALAVVQHFAPTYALWGDGGSADLFGDWKGRSLGLVDSPVLLANQLTFVCLPLVGLLAGVRSLDRRFLALSGATLLVAAGVYLTYTRSAVYASGVGIVAIGCLLRGNRRLTILGFVAASALMFQLLEGTGIVGQRYYRSAADGDRSAAGHEALWHVGFAIAMDHPYVGIGHAQFERISLYYDDVVGDDATDAGGVDALGVARPHNDFLSVWISWGILALVAYVALFAGALVNCVVAARRDDRLIVGLAVGTAGALATYAVNSTFHNYMDSSTLLWMFAGISAALTRISIPQVGLVTSAAWSTAAGVWPHRRRPRTPSRLAISRRGRVVR